MQHPEQDIYAHLDDKVIYAGLVCGAPGSGKTSFCHAMKEFMSQIGRETVIINFDPANDNLRRSPTEASPNTPHHHHTVAFSITDLITVDDVMEEFGLGPNGALLYCMEWLEDHIDDVYVKIMSLLDTDYPNCRFILFDFPGQIELYTNAQSVQNILKKMTQKWRFRCAVLHLTDSLLCKDPTHYISSLMVSLTTMLHLEMPHINVLTKVDLFSNSLDDSPLIMPLDSYDGMFHLQYLLSHIDKEYKYYTGDDEAETEGNDDYLLFDSDDDDFYNYDEDTDENNNEDEKLDPNDPTKVSKRVKKYLKNYKNINRAIVSVLDDFSMVELTHLSINDKFLMNNVLTLLDKAVGYAFKDIDLSTMQFTNNARNLLDQVGSKSGQNVTQRYK